MVVEPRERRKSDSQQDTDFKFAEEGKAGRLSTSFDNFTTTFSAEILREVELAAQAVAVLANHVLLEEYKLSCGLD